MLPTARAPLAGHRPLRLLPLVACALALAALPARALEVPSGFAATELVRGLVSPTAMAVAPDGRVFVCEQKGTLRLVKGGQLLATPFLSVPVDAQRERGLVGVAVHPDFPHTPYVYVYYTAFKPVLHNRLSRFTAQGDRAVPGSEKVLADLPPLDRDIHNGGALHFGADGKLYVGVGENGLSENAQSLETPLGKILRFDADGGIPADNPFATRTSGLAKAIWAMGLRNPFTFGFDQGSGRMYIDDVGFRTWEEIDEGVAGANYGWPLTEGPTTDPRFVAPVYAYRHGADAQTGCAITGGAFYDARARAAAAGTTLPPGAFPGSYDGTYFYADFCSGWVRRLDPVTHQTQAFATGIDGPVDLRVGPDGALYYLGYGFQHGVGVLGRIIWTGSGAPEIASPPQDARVAVGAPATFAVEATGDAPLAYQWRRDGTPIAGATGASYTLATTTLGDDGARFSVVVSNAAGSATSAPARLAVVNGHAPTVTITAPAAGTTYAGGDVIAYAGTATDVEDGALPPTAYTWRVDFHHRDHLHPYVPATSGATSGSFQAFRAGETDSVVWFRIHLDVVDSSGLSASTYVDVLPRTASFTVTTVPAGLQVLLDGSPRTTPFTETGVAGVQRELGAPSPQALGSGRWELVGWSDGGAPTHTIATPATSTTYTATFRAAAPEQHGLLATYFADPDLGTPKLVRVEPVVDATWRGAPLPGLPADGFSVRWEGELEAPATGAFTLLLRSDDGARLWLGGTQLIDDWRPHAARTARATTTLVAGQRYHLVVEMHDLAGVAQARLLWTGPGIRREVVPTARLFPAASGRR